MGICKGAHDMTDDIEPIEPVAYGDLYLRFDNELEATELLEDYPGSVDVIGIIYKPTGEVIETDEGEVAEMAAIEGWHANTRGPMVESLVAYAVEPEHPVRVWA
jgi:hypothetical protein